MVPTAGKSAIPRSPEGNAHPSIGRRSYGYSNLYPDPLVAGCLPSCRYDTLDEALAERRAGCIDTVELVAIRTLEAALSAESQ